MIISYLELVIKISYETYVLNVNLLSLGCSCPKIMLGDDKENYIQSLNLVI